MSKIIEKLKISGLFDNKEIEWDLGEVSVLVGKNGSGKTTILHTILNLLTQKKTKECFRTKNASLSIYGGGVLSYRSGDFQIGSDAISFLIKTLENKKERLSEDIKKALKTIIEIESTSSENVKKEMVVEQFNSDESLKGKAVTVEYISTVNLNANAKNKIEKGNGEETTALDWEIESEINRMRLLLENNKNETERSFHSFLNEINNLYSESEKKVRYDEPTKKLLVTWSNDDRAVEIKNLSSGERQLLYILLKSFNSSLSNPVILMDEPEISLHLSWQEKLISSMKNINKSCQIVIVTHSPAIVMDGWLDVMVDIDDIKKTQNKTVKEKRKEKTKKD